jgi:hypothetical protein
VKTFQRRLHTLVDKLQRNAWLQVASNPCGHRHVPAGLLHYCATHQQQQRRCCIQQPLSFDTSIQRARHWPAVGPQAWLQLPPRAWPVYTRRNCGATARPSALHNWQRAAADNPTVPSHSCRQQHKPPFGGRLQLSNLTLKGYATTNYSQPGGGGVLIKKAQPWAADDGESATLVADTVVFK